MEVKLRAYFFEFLTHFSILKPNWSMKRHRHAIALAGVARVLSYTHIVLQLRSLWSRIRSRSLV